MTRWSVVHQERCHHWFRWWIVTRSAPRHYLDQCWISVASTHRNKIQWNLKKKNKKFQQGCLKNSYMPHYSDVIVDTIVSQIASLTIVYSIVYSGADQRKHQSSASLAFVRGIHRWPVNSPHKETVTRKMIPFDDVIMTCVMPCFPHYWSFVKGIQRWAANFSINCQWCGVLIFSLW